jgi:hypothetical protein
LQRLVESDLGLFLDDVLWIKAGDLSYEDAEAFHLESRLAKMLLEKGIEKVQLDGCVCR